MSDLANKMGRRRRILEGPNEEQPVSVRLRKGYMEINIGIRRMRTERICTRIPVESPLNHTREPLLVAPTKAPTKTCCRCSVAVPPPKRRAFIVSCIMAFKKSRYTDASRSTFNDVGRDQIQNNTIINHQTIHVHLSASGSGQTLQHLRNISNDLPRLTPNFDTLSQGNVLSTTYQTVSAVETVVGLIVQITHLMDRSNDGNNHRDMELELNSLQQTLTLAKLAIQAYGDRPLGQSLANTITPQVERCRVVLLELLDGVNSTRQGLFFTSIRNLWHPVWRKRWDGDEVASLRMKMHGIRMLLGGFLMALNSYAFTFLQCSPPSEMPHSINLQCHMDGPWKRIACRL